jgi:hypothetical protein
VDVVGIDARGDADERDHPRTGRIGREAASITRSSFAGMMCRIGWPGATRQW